MLFAVHPNSKRHTGAIMTHGSGAIQSMLRKQMLNMCSSTKAELVGIDNAMTMILWSRLLGKSKLSFLVVPECKGCVECTSERHSTDSAAQGATTVANLVF